MRGLTFEASRPLRLRDGVCDDFFYVANGFLQFAFRLLLEPAALLFLATHQLPGFFLDLAAEVFQFAFDLILVGSDSQDRFLDGWLKRLPCEPGSVRTVGPCFDATTPTEQYLQPRSICMCGDAHSFECARRGTPWWPWSHLPWRRMIRKQVLMASSSTG